MSRLTAITRRMVARALEQVLIRLRIPPRWTRYRYLPSMPITELARRAGPDGVREAFASDLGKSPLPRNCTSSTELPTSRGRWGRSFADVPLRARAGTSVLSMSDCSVLAVAGEWGLEHFAILGPGLTRLKTPGTRWLPEHRRAIRSQSPDHFDHVAWPWESWYSNHFHWTMRQLPKLAILRDLGLGGQIVLPPKMVLNSVQREGASELGIDLEGLPRMRSQMLTADRLTVVHSPDLTSAVAGSMRVHYEHLLDAPTGERLYISRRHAGRRRLVNEDEVQRFLESRGFETLVFEGMGFAEQVRRCSRAGVIAGVHGAGLTNAVFTAPGSHVIEIADPRFPNPEYYELSITAGLSYWLLMGVPGPRQDAAGYGDVQLRVEDLQEVLDRLDAA